MYESLMEAVVNDEKVAQALEAVKRNQGAPGTWRLHGSRPPYRYVPPQGLSSGRAFVCLDRFLDGATQGPTWLRQPDIAAMCVEALHYGDQVLNHYRLQAWVVMPNHVHLLISPFGGVGEDHAFRKRVHGAASESDTGSGGIAILAEEVF
jgi:hypothetical protein